MEIQGLPLCPGCGGDMRVTGLSCPTCRTEVRGDFRPVLAGLSPQQQIFALRYLVARGNLKELERSLGISYQVLRGQLDDVVAQLQPSAAPAGRGDVLARLRRGELGAQDALRLLEEDRGVQGPEED